MIVRAAVEHDAECLARAALLIERVCRNVHALQGKFLRGGAYERASTRNFFCRTAVVAPSGDAHVSGRAFRHLAQRGDLPVRALLGSLPPLEWSYDAWRAREGASRLGVGQHVLSAWPCG